MALSSNSRLRATAPKPAAQAPDVAAKPDSAPASSAAEEMARLLDALGDAEPAPPPPTTNAPPPAKPALPKLPAAPSATRKLEEEPVHFVIPAGPGGATRPLGAILSSRGENKAPDLGFILPDLKSEAAAPAKSAPEPVRLAPATAPVHLTGNQSEAAKTAKHGTVRLTGNQSEAAKTAKHGTVRLTGNQSEAVKTAKHGTVRLTGNQSDAANAEKAPPPPLADAEKTPHPEQEAFPKAETDTIGESRPIKGRSPASLVVLLLLFLVLLLYVGFFILKPRLFTAGTSPQSSETVPAKPAPKAKPMATPKAQAKPKNAAAVAEPSPTEGQPPQAADTGQGLGQVDIPEDDDSPPAETGDAEKAEGATEADAPQDQPAQPAKEEAAPQSKFAPPWARKAPDPSQSQALEPQKVEEPVEVQAAVDVPEVREWPVLKVTAVIGSGKKGSVLVNGTVISVGEELEEGPVLKSVSRQAAVFEWDGDTRTIFVSSKTD